jgi:hypothetical protein
MSPTISSRALALAAVGGLSAVTLMALAPAATASHGGGREVIKSGSCTASADWKLKVKSDDAALETEYQVDSNRVGQVWNFSISDNAVVIAHGQAKTVAPSGSFTVRKVSANRAGADHFVAQARNVSTGERCTSTLTF